MNKSVYLGMFGMMTLNQSMGTHQNYVTWTLIALLFILKLKIFIKTLQMMLNDGLTRLTIMKIKLVKDCFQ